MDLSCYLQQTIEDIEKALGKTAPKGIYAGGALSALLLSKIWGRHLVSQEPFEVHRELSDHLEDTSDFVIRFTKPIRAANTSAPDLSQNGFVVVSTNSAENLRIKNIYRREPIITGLKDRMLYLLRGMDINALQVGLYIDGTSQLLFATENFSEFVFSKQLRITCPVSGSGFIRLAHYQAAFEAYVNWAEEALFMAGFRQMELPYNNPYDDMLSPEEYRTYLPQRNKVAPFCSVESVSEPVLHGLEEYFPRNWRIQFNPVVEWDTVAAAMTVVTKRKYFLTSYTYAVCFDILIRKSTRNSIKKRFLRAMMLGLTSEHALRYPLCLKSDFTMPHLLELQTFKSQHPAAMKIIVRLYQDFPDQLQVIRLLKKISRKHGSAEFVIGLLENAEFYGVRINRIDEETIARLIDACHVLDEPEIPPVDLHRFKYRKEVTELTSSNALYWEGARCSHCIGGYSGLLSQGEGKVRFFHISARGKHSTAVIYYDQQSEPNVYWEHYGPRNAPPPDHHILIIQELVGYLLKSIWKEPLHKDFKNENPSPDGTANTGLY